MSPADRLADAAPQDEPVLTGEEAEALSRPVPSNADLDAIEGQSMVTIYKPQSLGKTESLSRFWDHRTALRQQGWR